MEHKSSHFTLLVERIFFYAGDTFDFLMFWSGSRCERFWFGPLRLPVVWLLLFKWTSRLQTGHKWLWFIQSCIIEIPCKCLTALNMWWAFHVRWVKHCSVLFYTCLCLKVTRSSCTFFFFFLLEDVSVRMKITMQILLCGPSTEDQGLSHQHFTPFMDISFISCTTGQIFPSSTALIFCVSELWITVIPHCNKQMASRSWVITNPLREWLVLSWATLIRARWLLPLFAQALKSSSAVVTHRVCSG